jgi:hypothetical protein
VPSHIGLKAALRRSSGDVRTRHQNHAKEDSQRAMHPPNVLDSHKGGTLSHDHLCSTEIYLNISPEPILDDFQRKW